MTASPKLPIGSKYKCRPMFLDQNGRTITPAPSTPSFTSSDASKATVDASGVVTAVAAGTATITATSGDMTATQTFTIYTQIPSKLSL